VADATAFVDTRLEVEVSLHGGGHEVAEVEHDILFDTDFLLLVQPSTDCWINPDVGAAQDGCIGDPQQGPCKRLQRNLQSCPGSSGCPSGFEGMRLNIVVGSTFNRNPIPDGLLYTCEFSVLTERTGPTWIDSRNARATAPDQSNLPADGVDGIVVVLAEPTPTPTPQPPSNCCEAREDEFDVGCNDPVCEQCVCSVPVAGEPCCTIVWDAICADVAAVECADKCLCGQ